MTFYVGLDLGQAQDYTALSVVEKVTKTRHTKGSIAIDGDCLKITEDREDLTSNEYQIRHLQRFRIGTPYPEIVNRVRGMMAKLPDSYLVIDHTGVGRPVYDLFRVSSLNPIAITITGGDKTTHDGGIWHVPKRDLVAALSVAFQNGTLKIAAALPESKILINELLNFKVKINAKTAHDSYEAWREGIHDDLVLSVAMAIWYAARSGDGRFHIAAGRKRW